MCTDNKFWYTKIDNAVLDDPSLSRSCKAVFMTLCRHSHVDDRSCWLCVKTIAKESSYSIRTVKYALKKLIDAGLITRQDRFDSEDGSQISSLFTIIGYKAERYETPCNDLPPVQQLHAPQCNDCTHNKSPLTKDSLTREAELPGEDLSFDDDQNEAALITESESEPEPESKPVIKAVNIQEVPDIMRATAEYLLFKTGRESLNESELSSIRALSASHYPSRIQKEIDTACERFRRRKISLATLTFNYIAGALQYQNSRKPARKSAKNSGDMTQAEIEKITPAKTLDEINSEADELEALFREREARNHEQV